MFLPTLTAAHRRAVFLLSGFLALAALPPGLVRAQTVSPLVSFPATISNAQSGVISGGDGFLYGTAAGTATINGTIYKVKPDGTGFQIVYTFTTPNATTEVNADGQYPSRELVAPGDGYLYGTCANGGANGLGTIYRITPDGATFQTLHSFSAEDSQFDNTDGASPLSGLTVNGDGYLYGTTNTGGPDGEGTIFRISADGTVFQALHSFTFGNAADGDDVAASLLWGGSGYFYGTTRAGGAHSVGVVYRVKADGTGFSLLHSFTPTEGRSAAAVTLGLDGRLYGVNFQGGANKAGLLWGLNTDGTNFTTVHVFSAYNAQSVNADGAGPYGALAVGTDGTLYGTTQSGGAAGGGAVFRVSPDGSNFAVLDSFGTAGGDPTSPYGSLTRVGTVIYGTASLGGSLASGAVFQITGLSGTGHSRILWSHSPDNQASLWTVNLDSTFTSVQYGPYAGWTARAVSQAPDGTAHLLWTNANGTAAVWNVTASGFTVHQYGPFTGYAAVSLSTGADGVTHLLWNHAGGLASLWAVNTTTGAYTHTEYGPYSGWTANAVASGATVTDLLWTNTNGQADGYRVAADGTLITHLFGPYPNYAAKALSVGPDDGAHLLWDKTDGTAALWAVDFSTGALTSPLYGPFSGWTARAVATGPDNVTHLLWNHAPDNQASLWNITGSGHTSTQYGPYAGWQAIAVSAGQ